MTEIQTYKSIDLNHLVNIVSLTNDIDQIVIQIKQIVALKTVLQASNSFRANVVKYAKLEAAALIRCVELGGAEKLKHDLRRTALWLAEMDEDTRATYISMCEEGITIDQVWRREVKVEECAVKAEKELDDYRQGCVEELLRNGIVSIWDDANKMYVRSRSNAASKTSVEDWIDGTRNALRKKGGIGIGDGKGTYILPTPHTKDMIHDALFERWHSVMADLRNMVRIVRESGVKFSCNQFDANWKGWRDDKDYWIYLDLLILLENAGVMGTSYHDETISSIIKTLCVDYWEERTISWQKVED